MRIHHRAVCALGTKPTLASALIPMVKARLSISTSSAGAPPAGARCCRGRAHLCAKRNDGVLPKPVRDFFLSFLAAQYAGARLRGLPRRDGGQSGDQSLLRLAQGVCGAPAMRHSQCPPHKSAEPIAALHVLLATVGQCSARTERICRCRCRDNLKESNMNRLLIGTAVAVLLGLSPALAAEDTMAPATQPGVSQETSKSAHQPSSGSADTSGGAAEQSSAPPSSGAASANKADKECDGRRLRAAPTSRPVQRSRARRLPARLLPIRPSPIRRLELRAPRSRQA